MLRLRAYRPHFQQQGAGGHSNGEADGHCTHTLLPFLVYALALISKRLGKKLPASGHMFWGNICKNEIGASLCLSHSCHLNQLLPDFHTVSILFVVTAKPLAQREEGMWETCPWKSLFSLLLCEPRKMAFSCGPRGICFLALGQLYDLPPSPPAAMDNRGYGLWKGDTGLKANGRLQN